MLTLSICVSLLPSACDGTGELSTPGDASEVRLVDGLGRELKLAAPARRIVSIAPSNTEILYALGAASALVCRDDLSDHPEAARNVRSIGDTYPRPALESIVLCEPDLILAAGLTGASAVEDLARLGVPVYAARDAQDFEDVFADIRGIARLVDRVDAGEDLIGTLLRRIEKVKRMTAGRRRRLVFFEMDGGDPARPWTCGEGTFVDRLLELAGGDNLGRRGDERYYQMSLEQLVLADPESILVSSSRSSELVLAAVRRRPGWSELSAVKAGRVWSLDEDLITRPGPRLVDGLEAMVARLQGKLEP